MKPAVLRHLPWRVAGVVLLGVLVVAYQPESDSTVQRLIIPVAMAIATWLMVQKVVAVSLGAGLLAAIHSAPGSDHWIPALAYPTLAAICGVILAAVLAQRFRRHIADTHDARWRSRRNGGGTAS